VTCAADVLEVLGLDPVPPPAPAALEPRSPSCTPRSSMHRPRSTSCSPHGLGAGHVAAALAELELRGLVIQAAGLYRGVMA
jgi:hypothetical protein